VEVFQLFQQYVLLVAEVVVVGHRNVEPLEVQVEEQELIKVVQVVQEIHLPQLLIKDLLVEIQLQVQLPRLI